MSKNFYFTYGEKPICTIGAVAKGTYRLPVEYQEVEWIASSGTQRIDTGLLLQGQDLVKAKFSYVGTGYLFGATHSGSPTECRFGAQTYSESNVQVFNRVNDTGGQIIWTDLSSPYIIESKLCTFGTIDGYSTINEHTFIPSRIGAYDINKTLNIFAIPYTSSYRYGSSKCHYFSIKRSGSFIFYGIPCYRKSDSVIGMYDLVSGEFFTNAGTGTFTKGDDV